MNFVECRAYLERLQVHGVKLGLNNVRALLAALGEPHRRFPSVLVAGTNGKGSVCAMLAGLIDGHGLRVGLYTSPHLVDVRERIRVGGRMISRPAFCRAMSKVRRAAAQSLASGRMASPPTHFEALTCAALDHFRTEKVDLAVLEVGLGGRFDATNAVTPILSVITTIGLDHERYLGSSPARIALEKAGIIRPSVPVVCGVRRGEAHSVIHRRAREEGAPFIGVFDAPRRLRALRKKSRYEFLYSDGTESFRLAPRLPGRHQGDNAAVALAAALELNRAWRPLHRGDILRGIARADWPGRLEVACRGPLVLLDGAHNPDGARALGAYIREFIRLPVVLVFAAMGDKDIRGLGRILFPLGRKIILTKFPYHRAAEPADILRLAGPHAVRAIVENDPRRAFREALAWARRLRGCVLVTGSLFLVGEVKRALDKTA